MWKGPPATSDEVALRLDSPTISIANELTIFVGRSRTREVKRGGKHVMCVGL